MLRDIKEKMRSGMGKDVIWTFTLQITIMLCTFAVNKLLASRLSIDDFGQYNVIKRSVQVLSFVMLAGIGIALPRYIPLYRKGYQTKPITPLIAASFIYIIGVTITVIFVCCLFCEEMQLLILGSSGKIQLLIISLAYAFTLAIAQFIYAYYRGLGNFKWFNGAQLGIQLAIVLPLLFLPILTTTTVFVSWLMITAMLVIIYFVREIWLHPFVSQNSFTTSSLIIELKTIMKYSSGRLLADFFLFTFAAFPLIFISNTRGLQTTAFFSVGITFVTMVTPLFSFMGIILLPYVSECIAKKDMKSANHFVNRLAILYVFFSLLIMAVLFIFINFFTSFFFSGSYLITTDISRIMILSLLPQAIYRLYRNPIDAISVIPYNTIILGACLFLMIITFFLSTTLTQLALAYLCVSCLQGLLSWLTWQFIKSK